MNAVGLNLLLQASPQQLQDLLQNQQPGTLMRGRIVDLLPQGRAVINLQGQNLLAQLPPQSVTGAAFQKGDLLTLQVTQAASNSNPKAGAAPDPNQALTLRLVSNSNVNAPAQNSALAGSQALNLPLTARVALPPQAGIEQALGAARLPVNSATIAVAQTLAAHGLPLDPPTLQSVVQQAESLLAAEQANPSPSTAGQNSSISTTPVLPAETRAILQDALTALRMAVQSTPTASAHIIAQRALNLVEGTLQANAASQAPMPGQTSLPTPGLTLNAPPATPNSSSSSIASPSAGSPPVPSTNTPNLTAPIQPVQAAVQAVLNDPSLANLQALQGALAPSAIFSPQPQQVPGSSTQAPAPTTGNALPAQAAASTAPAPLPPTAALPIRREAVVQLFQALPTPEADQPLLPASVSAAAQALSQALNDTQSPQSQALVRSVQSQFPQAQPTQILNEAKQALAQVVEHFDSLPVARPLPGPQAIGAELEAAALPAPRATLSQFPREVVFEAVAWLRARGLPPQRPLVEAAAQFLTRGQANLELAARAASAQESLPEGLLTWRPGLKQAFVNLDRAIQNSTLKLDGPDLGAQLRQWPKSSGLALEKDLLQAFEAAQPESPTSSAVTTPGTPVRPQAGQPTLREALAQVQHEIKEALRDPAGASASVAPKLEQAASDANRAMQGLSALPLQAQPSPSFQSVTLPLALPLNGPLNGGQLTVTWRQGQGRNLDEKDPVNVAVALNTESLGEVKVLLQVWKGHASAVVKAQDEETAAFLATGAAELKQGFAERTPFRLQNLDFDVSQPGEALPGEEAVLPQGAGLNLSA